MGGFNGMAALVARMRGYAGWMAKYSLLRDTIYRPNKADRPFLVRLDLNNTCNQWCAKCFYPRHAEQNILPHYMTVAEFRTLASKLFEFTYYLQIPLGFEPLLHPQFGRMMEIADEYGIPNIGIVTNGTLLCGDKVEAILRSRSITAVAVSIDAIDPLLYRRIHGRNDLDRVRENVAEFVRRKRAAGRDSLHLFVNATIERQSLEYLPGVLRWSVAVGADEVQFFHIEPVERANPASVLGEPGAYNRIHDELGSLIRSSPIRVYLPPPLRDDEIDALGRLTRRHTQEEKSSPFETSQCQSFGPEVSHPYPRGPFCICPWMTWVIDPWGNVFPCSHRLEIPFSNILRDPMPKAFNSFRHLRLRRDQLRGRGNGKCQSCHSKSAGSDPMRRQLTRWMGSQGSRLALACGVPPE